MKKNKNVRFVRIRGRVIPIRGNKNSKALKDITASKNRGNLAKIACATAAGLGGLFASGKIQKASDSFLKTNARKSLALNKIAKISKFSSKALPALIVGTALASIDRNSRDEGSAFDIGNKKGAFNVAASLGVAFAFTRIGKRFEKFGLRGGKFPIKLRDI